MFFSHFQTICLRCTTKKSYSPVVRGGRSRLRVLCRQLVPKIIKCHDKQKLIRQDCWTNSVMLCDVPEAQLLPQVQVVQFSLENPKNANFMSTKQISRQGKKLRHKHSFCFEDTCNLHDVQVSTKLIFKKLLNDRASDQQTKSFVNVFLLILTRIRSKFCFRLKRTTIRNNAIS